MFIEKKVTPKSLSIRRLILGVGINDADYLVYNKYKGRRVTCPYYSRWVKMIERCYSKKYQKNSPTYKGCSVCDEWLVFSAFKNWMERQDWEGKDLDKDIIVFGNKIYSPDTCAFVDRSVNLLLGDNKASRGKYPIGVYYDKRRSKYLAWCGIIVKRKFLGHYNTQNEASNAYKKYKHDFICKVAKNQTDYRVKIGLIKHAKLILNKKD